MSWQCIELTITAEKEAYYSELFDEFGAQAITISGADATRVFENDGQASDSWQLIKLSGMFDSDSNLKSFFKQLATHKDIRVRTNLLQDRDWEQAWLDNYKPQQINQKLWVCPSWLEPVDPLATTITIDPGMSFGTGTHESTRLCLQWLTELNVEQSTVMDYGCGTGILAIAAVKLGAKSALATDIESRAMTATIHNAGINNVSHAVKTCPPVEMPEIQVDLVIANILAGAIINLAPLLTGHTKPRGQLLLAGILREQEQTIKEVLSEFNWLSRYDNDWVAMLGNKKR